MLLLFVIGDLLCDCGLAVFFGGWFIVLVILCLLLFGLLVLCLCSHELAA